MALRRVVSTRNPVHTVAMAAGTNNEPTCSLASGKVRAKTSDAPVPSAPSSRQGKNPMKGSISRRMAASRIARKSIPGMSTPLTRMVPMVMSTIHVLNPSCTHKVRTPRITPCPAEALTTACNRLVPSRNRLKSRTTTSRGPMRLCMCGLPCDQDDAQRGKQACRQEKDRDLGHPEPGHGRFHHADEHGQQDHAAGKHAPAGPGIFTVGDGDANHQRAKDEQLQGRCVFDQPERRAAVVEHHDF